MPRHPWVCWWVPIREPLWLPGSAREYWATQWSLTTFIKLNKSSQQSEILALSHILSQNPTSGVRTTRNINTVDRNSFILWQRRNPPKCLSIMKTIKFCKALLYGSLFRDLAWAGGCLYLILSMGHHMPEPEVQKL